MHVDWAGVRKASGERRLCAVSVSRSSPAWTVGFCAVALQLLGEAQELRIQRGRPGEVLGAGGERLGKHRRALRERREARAQLLEQRRGVVQERLYAGAVGITALNVGGVSEIHSWRKGTATGAAR